MKFRLQMAWRVLRGKAVIYGVHMLPHTHLYLDPQQDVLPVCCFIEGPDTVVAWGNSSWGQAEPKEKG